MKNYQLKIKNCIDSKRSPKERALIHMSQRRTEANLLDAVGTYFHHATPGLGAEIEGYQNQEWGKKQRERAISTMHRLNETLAGQPYIAGENFSVADITAIAGFAFADFCEIEIPEEATHLKAWRDRVNARPSAKA